MRLSGGGDAEGRIESLEMVLSMRTARGEGEMGVRERCRRLLRNYAAAVGRRLGGRIARDPLSILRIEGAHEWARENFRICGRRPGVEEAVREIFNGGRLMHTEWQEPFLFGFEELRRAVPEPVEYLVACMCRVMEEEAVELVHCFSAGEPERFYPHPGRFFELGARREALDGLERVYAGMEDERLRTMRVGDGRLVRKRQFSRAEVVHLAVGLNRHWGRWGYIRAIARDADLIFSREGIRTEAELRGKVGTLKKKRRLCLEGGMWLLDGRQAQLGDEEGEEEETGRMVGRREIEMFFGLPVAQRRRIEVGGEGDAADRPTTPIDAADHPTTPIDTADHPTTPTDTADHPTTPTDAGDDPTTPTDAGDHPTTPTDATDCPTTPNDAADHPTTPTDAADDPTTPIDTADHPPTPTDATDCPPTPTDATDRPTTPIDAADHLNTLNEVPSHARPSENPEAVFVSLPSLGELVPTRPSRGSLASSPTRSLRGRDESSGLSPPRPSGGSAAVPESSAGHTRGPPTAAMAPAPVPSSLPIPRGIPISRMPRAMPTVVAPARAPASGVIDALRRTMRANVGRTLSQSALARQLDSRVRPERGEWGRILRRLEGCGAVQLEGSASRQKVRVISWEGVTEANLFGGGQE